MRGRRAAVAAAPRGFTLLEVMVTIIVLALGLLGLASLQVFSLKNNHVSYYRAIASQQAYDMEDRLRANLAGVVNSPGPDGTIYTTNCHPANPNNQGACYDDLLSAGVLPADPACVNTAAGCTADNMALTDAFQWLSNTAALLPGGKGMVSCIRGPLNSFCAPTIVLGAARVYRIIVTWQEKDMGDTGPTSSDANCTNLVPPLVPLPPANTRCFVTLFSP